VARIIPTCEAGLLLFVAALLAACATASSPAQKSAYGAYLAGYVASKEGNHAQASRFLGSAIASTGDQSDKAKAHIAAKAAMNALEAGDIERAFALARAGRAAHASSDDARLMIVAAQCCEVALKEPPPSPDRPSLAPGLHLAFPYVAAWSALGSGDIAAALAALPPQGDTLFDLQMVPVTRALMLDLVDHEDAALAYAQAIAGQSRTAMLADAYSRFLRRRGDAVGAAELYDVLSDGDSGPRVFASGMRLLEATEEPARLIATPQAGVADLLATLGLFLAADGREEEAVLALRLSIGIAPDLIEARFALAEFLRVRGRYVEAEAIISNPGSLHHPRMTALRALLAEQQGDPSRALQFWDQLIDGDAQSVYALDRADLLLRVGRFDDAVQTLDPIIAGLSLDSHGSWWPHLARGRAHLALADWESAEKDLLRALVLAPENAGVLAALGEGIVRFGSKPESGLALLERAARKEAYNGEFLKALGRTQLQLCRLAEAIPTLERAVQLLPASAEALEHLGDAYWLAGRAREAGYQWQHAAEISLDPASRKRLDAKLYDPLDAMEKDKEASL
jgi:tetratricopeptide (TPR) repeat protein